MKTYLIENLLKKDLLIIETSEQITLTITATGHMIRDNSTNEEIFIEGYTILGRPDKIREEDAKELVHKNELGYTNYNAKTALQAVFSKFPTATESLLSGIERVIFWNVNPIPKPDYFTTENSHIHVSNWSDFMQEWNEAELRTFDRSRSIILIKK